MTASPHRPDLDASAAQLTALVGWSLEVDEAGPGGWGRTDAAGAVRLGVHRAGPRPEAGLDGFDILLSADPHAPAPWVGLAGDSLDAAIAHLRAVMASHSLAATVAAQVLRMTLPLSFADALTLESLAYSMLLASADFRAWRAAHPPRLRAADTSPRVRLARDNGALQVRLARPQAHNAVDARMRDALAEALSFALEDPEISHVILSGEGPSFSAGGDLDEFGQASDPGLAHAIRLTRSATSLVHQLGARAEARLHGACIGAGIEIPAAAARVLAKAGTVFRLPEVSMGLIPGAGGTASIPRRIGRHRACFMAVSGLDIDLSTALAWGLVDGLDPAP